MTKLIDEIVEIIGNYRADEDIFINSERISKWIDQFDGNDRNFILNELKLIFQKRYISKEHSKTALKKSIEYIANSKGYINTKSFLQSCQFIDHQPEGKSQKVILSILNEIFIENYSISLTNCGSDSLTYLFYSDDFLCTGDTLFKALLGLENKLIAEGYQSLADYLSHRNIKILLHYFYIHRDNYHKVFKRLKYSLKRDITNFIETFYSHGIIENDSIINSQLDFLWPIYETPSESIINCQNQIEEKVNSYCISNQLTLPPSQFYRNPSYPIKEIFFSSPANRKKFESIILNKSIEIYNSANSDYIRMRPLGYGLNRNLSFGFGTLCFSWRNVPFNVPLIFWYPHRGWFPLFERNFIRYNEGE